MFWRKILLVLSCFALFCLLANLFWFYSDDQFQVSNFQIAFFNPIDKNRQSIDAATEAELQKGLGQPFHYLGHGKQSMAFESSDQQYVLKFFYKRRPLRKNWYTRLENWLRFSSPSWIYKTWNHRRNSKKLLRRYQMACEELKEQTGLIYVHIYQNEIAERSLELTDRWGMRHSIDLSAIPFVLQKKAELAHTRLKRLRNRAQQRENAIVQLKELFKIRAQKGFTDRRQVFKKNYGFIGERAIQIDVGKIRKDQKIANAPIEDLERIYKKLDIWLLKH